MICIYIIYIYIHIPSHVNTESIAIIYIYVSQHMNSFPVPILGRGVFPQGLVTSPRLFQREITGHGKCGFHRLKQRGFTLWQFVT